MARGFRGVKDDLSELGRHLLDVAYFLAPILAGSATYETSPNPNYANPNNNNSIMSDLVEFGAGVKSGIARVSAALKKNNSKSGINNNNNITREEVLRFVRDLVKCPESWIEFPVPINDDFELSRHQRDHIATVEGLAPSLATLRISLCPSFMTEESFWKIYFALLHPKLNKLESEFLSTQEIVDEMRVNLKKKMQSRVNSESQAETASPAVSGQIVANSQQDEPMHANLNSSISESQNLVTERSSSLSTGNEIETCANESNDSHTNLQYIDRWFGTKASLITSEMNDASTQSRQHSGKNKEGDYYTDDDNIVVMQSNRNFSYEHLHVGKKTSSDEESSDWQAVEENSDFEILEKS